MKIKSLFQFAIYIYMIDEVTLSNKWIEGVNNASAVVGCRVQLPWKLFSKDHLVSIYKISGKGVENRLTNSEKYQIDTSQVHKISIIITNITMDDAGVYRCQDNVLINDWADLYLTVMDDILSKNSSIDVKAGVGDDVTISWEYSIIGIDKDITIFRNKNETTPSPEITAENEKLIDKGDDPRMKVNITKSDDGRTEVVMLTIHTTTIDDFNYIYNMKIQFNNNCVRYAEPMLLIEVPRVYSQMIGRPTEDIKFVWHYHYSSPSTNVIFNRYNTSTGQNERVGYWNGTRFYSYIGEDRLQFSNTSVSFGQKITVTLKNTTVDDFNTIYGCNITFRDGVIGYNETKLLYNPGPRMEKVPTQRHGKLGDDIILYWIYTYRSKATDIRFFHINSSGKSFLTGHWIKNQGYQSIGNNSAVFHQSTVEGKERITLVILNTDENDYNSIYTCQVILDDISRNLTAIELILIPDTGPRMEKVPTQRHGKLGDDISLYWIYTYRSKAIDIRFFHINSCGKSFLTGHWIKNQGYQSIGNNSAVFYESTVEGKEKITLVILNTDENDYNSIYTCQVIFDDISRNLTAIELILIPDTAMPEKDKSTFEIHLMIASVTVMVLTCFIIGIVVCRYKCRSHKHERPRRASDTTNDMRHSYISLNSVVIFHANHESTTTSAESTASNDIDDDTEAYANPYDPINRDGIDTSKNLYMSLQNPGTSNINQGDDVQETDVDGNSVTTIDDVQTADDDDDDETSTHDSKPYDALNKYTMNSDIHSYLSLPPCTRSEYRKNDHLHISSPVDDIKIVKKRSSTI